MKTAFKIDKLVSEIFFYVLFLGDRLRGLLLFETWTALAGAQPIVNKLTKKYLDLQEQPPIVIHKMLNDDGLGILI